MRLRHRLRPWMDDVIQEIDGETEEEMLEVVKLAATDFRKELAAGRPEVVQEKTTALATSVQLAAKAAEAAGVATTAVCIEARRLCVDYAPRPFDGPSGGLN